MHARIFYVTIAFIIGNSAVGKCPESDAPATDMQRIQGTWRVIYAQLGNEVEGKKVGAKRTFREGKLEIEWKDDKTGRVQTNVHFFTLKSDRQPKEIHRTGRKSGIYVLEGDILMMCLPAISGMAAPNNFELPKRNNFKYIEILRRER